MLRQLIALMSLGLLLCQCNSQPENNPPDSTPKVEMAAAGQVLHLPFTDTLPYPIVETFDELALVFEQKNGKTYVINFWATWCGPCVEELPYFEKLNEEEDVEVILVSLDFKREVRGKLLKFVREQPLNLPVIAFIDPQTNIWIDRVDPEWGGAIPITIIYRNDQRQLVLDQFPNYEALLATVHSVQ